MPINPLRAALFLSLLLQLTACAFPKVVILNDPLSEEEHLRLGLSYEAQGEWDRAISEYRTALDKGGSPSVIFGYLGNVYYAKKEYAAAEESYEKSLQRDPRNAPILNNLASLYLAERKELAEAEWLVQRAIALDPPRKPYYLDTLAEIYLARTEYELALAVYGEAAKLAPADSPFHKQLRERSDHVLELLEENGTGGSEK